MDFNTSYVVVQRILAKSCSSIKSHFNTSYVVVQRKKNGQACGGKLISIHLMLWFNSFFLFGTSFIKKFQYILCCGSTLYVHARNMHGIIFQYILCCGSTPVLIPFPTIIINISIHLMLWFNFSKTLTKITSLKFQYILCCGSTRI